MVQQRRSHDAGRFRSTGKHDDETLRALARSMCAQSRRWTVAAHAAACFHCIPSAHSDHHDRRGCNVVVFEWRLGSEKLRIKMIFCEVAFQKPVLIFGSGYLSSTGLEDVEFLTSELRFRQRISFIWTHPFRNEADSEEACFWCFEH